MSNIFRIFAAEERATEPALVDSSVGADAFIEPTLGADTAEQISAFEQILQRFEQNTITERDKGTSFELLVREVLSKAQPWYDQFEKVQTYADWAKEHPELTGGDSRDTGVDLVATNRVPPIKDGAAIDYSNDGLAHNAGIAGQIRIESRGGG